MSDLLQYLGSHIVSQTEPDMLREQFKGIFQRVHDGELIGNWHPLGFVHVKLGEVPGYGTLRWHIWPKGIRRTQTPNWPIHNHIFTVNSFVLCGTVTNTTFNVRDDNLTPTNCLYQVKYSDGGSILSPTEDKVTCAINHFSTFEAGSFYVVSKDQYHTSSVPITHLTSTVVLATDIDLSIKPLVVGRLDKPQEFRYARSILTTSELISITSVVEQCYES